MTKKWRFEPEALDEVIEAARYYDGQRGGLGIELFDAIKQALGSISEVPERATPHPYAPRELTLLCHRMRRFPYVIVFHEAANENRILAVAHVRREPLYWLSRVPRT